MQTLDFWKRCPLVGLSADQLDYGIMLWRVMMAKRGWKPRSINVMQPEIHGPERNMCDEMIRQIVKNNTSIAESYWVMTDALMGYVAVDENGKYYVH